MNSQRRPEIGGFGAGMVGLRFAKNKESKILIGGLFGWGSLKQSLAGQSIQKNPAENTTDHAPNSAPPGSSGVRLHLHLTSNPQSEVKYQGLNKSNGVVGRLKTKFRVVTLRGPPE